MGLFLFSEEKGHYGNDYCLPYKGGTVRPLTAGADTLDEETRDQLAVCPHSRAAYHCQEKWECSLWTAWSTPEVSGFHTGIFGRSLWGTATVPCMSMRLYKFSSFLSSRERQSLYICDCVLGHIRLTLLPTSNCSNRETQYIGQNLIVHLRPLKLIVTMETCPVCWLSTLKQSTQTKWH